MAPHLTSLIVGDIACTEDQPVNSFHLQTALTIVSTVPPFQRRLEAMEAEYGGVLGCVVNVSRTTVTFIKECVRKCASYFLR